MIGIMKAHGTWSLIILLIIVMIIIIIGKYSKFRLENETWWNKEYQTQPPNM